MKELIRNKRIKTNPFNKDQKGCYYNCYYKSQKNQPNSLIYNLLGYFEGGIGGNTFKVFKSL